MSGGHCILELESHRYLCHCHSDGLSTGVSCSDTDTSSSSGFGSRSSFFENEPYILLNSKLSIYSACDDEISHSSFRTCEFKQRYGLDKELSKEFSLTQTKLNLNRNKKMMQVMTKYCDNASLASSSGEFIVSDNNILTDKSKYFYGENHIDDDDDDDEAQNETDEESVEYDLKDISLDLSDKSNIDGVEGSMSYDTTSDKQNASSADSTSDKNNSNTCSLTLSSSNADCGITNRKNIDSDDMKDSYTDYQNNYISGFNHSDKMKVDFKFEDDTKVDFKFEDDMKVNFKFEDDTKVNSNLNAIIQSIDNVSGRLTPDTSLTYSHEFNRRESDNKDSDYYDMVPDKCAKSNCDRNDEVRDCNVNKVCDHTIDAVLNDRIGGGCSHGFYSCKIDSRCNDGMIEPLPLINTCLTPICDGFSFANDDVIIDSPDDNMSAHRLQDEVLNLQQALKDATDQVKKMQAQLDADRRKSKQLVMLWQMRIRDNEEAMKRQLFLKNSQLGEIMSQLLFFEGQLKMEQKRIMKILHEKDLVIKKQDDRIKALTKQNSELQMICNEIELTITECNSNDQLDQLDFTHHIDGVRKNSVKESQCKSEENINNNAPVSSISKKLKNPFGIGSIRNRMKRHQSNLELRTLESTILEETPEQVTGASLENILPDSPVIMRRRNRERCRSIAGYPLADLSQFANSQKELEALMQIQETYRKGLLDTPESSSPSPSSSSLMSSSKRTTFCIDGEVRCPGESEDNGHDLVTVRETFHGSSDNLSRKNNSPNNLLLRTSSSIENIKEKIAKENPFAKLKNRRKSHSELHLNLAWGSDSSSDNKSKRTNSDASKTSSDSSSSSNPLKTIKSLIQRKSNKIKMKRRSASLSQPTPSEYAEALNNHLLKQTNSVKQLKT